ncbi:MAG: hypothetical protein AAF573_02110 [Bacteroidota bacterium]
MSSSKEINQNQPRFSRSDITAFFALVISVGALGVSVYEASILRSQQEIMRNQQKASVLPYLVPHQNYAFSTNGNKFTYTFENKGIGPGRITRARLKINDQKVSTYSEVLKQLKVILPAEVDFGLSFKNPENYFISAKEEITALEINFPRFENDYQVVHDLDLDFEICFCSIYDDCWSLLREENQPQKGCP